MIKSISKEQLKSIRHRLHILYGGEAERLLERIFMMIGRYGVGNIELHTNDHLWDEKDNVLITYADSILEPEAGSPLAALGRFGVKHLKGTFRTIHLLPFYPWSSDDGFSVINYREVDPDSGSWEDVQELSKNFNLMFDLVLNHCSSRSSWFKDYVAGIQPARHYFLEMDPKGDYSQVVRPRTSPLLRKTMTRDGKAHVWTTFSADQIDLNWQNPEVLIEFLDILILYLAMGMRIVRLDAVAFLWKKPGTNCIHLPETHEVVKLLRDICEIIAPGTILLTETNVPHEENISYFGRGDEAHMVYQFSLPPLLLHGLVTSNASYLTKWARELGAVPENCTFFNFTASHDGVGVRPVEGLLPEQEIQTLIGHVEDCGGRVSMRTLPDGSQKPYELNITYFSALSYGDDDLMGARRFLCSQALMLSLKGIPGIYIHSLIATSNDYTGMESSKINRRINRRKWNRSELHDHLQLKIPNFVFETMLQMIRKRSMHPAFHPDGVQEVLQLGPELFAMTRCSPGGDEQILCLYNFTAEKVACQRTDLPEVFGTASRLVDILKGRKVAVNAGTIKLDPYQAAWLTVRD